ncbi:hypothetical protein NC652_038886 [Populus alba x Populus x berolinensis]|nr:hypothetical protein NC652_038886 [Populus alba x Populus x berolinensis]
MGFTDLAYSTRHLDPKVLCLDTNKSGSALNHYSRWNQAEKGEETVVGPPRAFKPPISFHVLFPAFTRPPLCERRDRDLNFGLLGSSRSLRIFAGPLAALACVLTRP